MMHPRHIQRRGQLVVVPRRHCLAAAWAAFLERVDRSFDRATAWLDGRYEALRFALRSSLIVTSNATPATLGIRWRSGGIDDSISAAIVDRMREMCGRFIHVQGKSYRGVR